MNVKIRLLHNCEDIIATPQYATDGSSGADLYAVNNDEICIKSNQIALIPCGFSMAIPEGYEAQIRSRSGLALKNGIFVLNSPGTIDSDYRGEVKVILMNLSNSDFFVKKGMKIAQMVIAKVEKVSFCLVDELDDTDRGEGGFGSTGV